MRLRLPLVSKRDDAEAGLAFDFLADGPNRERVLTGHADGVITLNIAEADPVQRERIRSEMGEPYRTLLGHLRHEIGHYYWERLVRNRTWQKPVRALFGDDTQDYSEALQTHYQNGAPADWQSRFVTAYASSHPWEDWAETWAHYLHLVDTLETAFAFGIRVRPHVDTDSSLQTSARSEASFEKILDTWLPVSFAVNSLNRSMGQDDLYPFVLTSPVLAKLELIHRIVRAKHEFDT